MDGGVASSGLIFGDQLDIFIQTDLLRQILGFVSYFNFSLSNFNKAHHIQCKFPLKDTACEKGERGNAAVINVSWTCECKFAIQTQQC